MTDQDDKQSKSGSGRTDSDASNATEDVTREGTKEDIRTVDQEKPPTKTDTPDNLRDGTKS